MIPKLTDAGKNLLLRALAGETIKFTKIQLGNGAAQDPRTAGGLINPLLTVLFSKIEIGVEYVTLTATFTNGKVTSGFHITEAGFFAEDPDNHGEEILYALGYEDTSTADYVPDCADRILEMQFDAFIFVGDAENVTAAISGSLVYATAEELAAHADDNQNPHSVTKEQVGLGAVPNVTTNDQAPTYDDAIVLAPLSSGEKVSTAFGKIKTAVAKLIEHLSDKRNPHSVTAEQAGAAEISHTHSAVDINDGTLSVLRGGTGLASPAAGGLLRGNGAEACTALRGTGALFSPEIGSPRFGTLPVSMGGTGVTNREALLTLIKGGTFVFGGYEGTGTQGRVINLGYQPQAVLLFDACGSTYDDADGSRGGLALQGYNVIGHNVGSAYIASWDNRYCVLGVVENGFIVNENESAGIKSNESGHFYFYIVIR